ncbi:hypothetical protein [Sporocytophaga myxococcoides]|nr:hypothetical protein [Sporocytophaga myxococcoides]
MKELAMLSNLENVSVNLEAKTKGKSAQVIFCENWDNAKVALGAIAAMVKNPVVKLVINIVVSVGDGIKGKVCV